mmetsp:Transcript_4645/g.6260  ORF Transcript_4645/g.6260 Transcript_4645/m.6260 type:complete len:102 (+) Transcript_4645:111-416(+)
MATLGGHSAPKDANDNIKQITLSLQKAAEDHLGASFPKFEALSYTEQVVAGMVYHVAVDAGDQIVHVRCYQPLPHTGLSTKLEACKISEAGAELQIMQKEL